MVGCECLSRGARQYKKALEDRRRWIKLAKASKEVEPKRLRAVQISLGKIIDKVEKPGRAAGYYDRLAGGFKDPTAQLQAWSRCSFMAADTIESSLGEAGEKRSERRLAEAVARYKEQGLELSGEAANVVAEAELAALEPAYLELPSSACRARIGSNAFNRRGKPLRIGWQSCPHPMRRLLGSVVGPLRSMLLSEWVAFGIDTLNLMSVPAPRGLSEVQRELWQDKLTEWTMPIETQALTYYEKVRRVGTKSGTGTPRCGSLHGCLESEEAARLPPPGRGVAPEVDFACPGILALVFSISNQVICPTWRNLLKAVGPSHRLRCRPLKRSMRQLLPNLPRRISFRKLRRKLGAPCKTMGRWRPMKEQRPLISLRKKSDDNTTLSRGLQPNCRLCNPA